jgi:hypothetical protein
MFVHEMMTSPSITDSEKLFPSGCIDPPPPSPCMSLFNVVLSCPYHPRPARMSFSVVGRGDSPGFRAGGDAGLHVRSHADLLTLCCDPRTFSIACVASLNICKGRIHLVCISPCWSLRPWLLYRVCAVGTHFTNRFLSIQWPHPRVSSTSRTE